MVYGVWPMTGSAVILTNRRQYVRIGKFNSVLSLIKCGVPQGSILGANPILNLYK